ncbi:FAD-binding domain-containing protein [Cucurbitaria berberidis CBS 394.84]|uniref:FAD-binding domain-containing protein n=1 Tax=Cucurbitaria berberidis CBS 394.84 TaxID=1168544 RepID=A0A9P4GMB2_9PLEO|nr:FAD-binding domain-containing protein [Cucurbitaria berberidis CBS 394.84]KAF1847676.1 FAD-binding domain-containing protein [Cucurbitaria berberidis CBS 394.84]
MRFIVTALTLFGAVLANVQPSSRCKTFPGDKAWPSKAEWNNFNRTVGGQLVATVPLGTPCHGASFDNATCESLKSQWQYEKIHYESSSSVMAPFFANQSCDPFQPRDSPCELGNYVRYAVNASKSSDIQRAIAFASSKDIRLVIRNTGHDYRGRSTGAGSLAVWTHHLKDISHITAYKGSGYSGAAFKLGAGVQGFEIMAAARDKGLVVVGGECPTVGIAGGYTQGGGHSAISTSFGLAADNVLSWEVVTASGKLVNANKDQNPDLYWALNGGGGSTYGVVVSMTVKAHKEAVFGGASLSFFTTNNAQDVFYDAIEAFHEELPAMVDAGTMVVHYFTSSFFMIAPLNAYNKTAAEVKTILAPFIAKLDAKSVNYTVNYSEFDTYYKHYDKYFGPLPLGNIQVGIAQYGARLIPRSVVGNITETWKAIVEKGVTWIGVGTNVKSFGSEKTTSVHPAWRNAIVHATLTLPWNFTAPWSEVIATQEKMTNVIQPLVEAATPGSGSYVNEADWRQPNFQTTFWGSNYNKLLSIKRKWDPSSLFYATVGVGSEAWTVRSDGRMCRAR